MSPTTGNRRSIFMLSRFVQLLRPLIHALSLSVLLLLSGCSGFQALPTSNDPGASIQNPDVRSVLYREYETWRGTPYRLGGLSERGVDCSGLVYLTFRDAFATPLPRTTRKQSTKGEPVSRHALQSGDLVFFQTGVNTRHVGIYIEQNKFLHASTSRGVMVSYLTSDYWDARFTHARRIPIQ